MGLFGKSAGAQELKTVANVDLAKYMGKWFEIAAFPQRFERGCNCTTAEYEMTNKNYVKVTNTCLKGADFKTVSRAVGKAFVVKGSNNAKLKVQFFWPFRGNYWIIELADDYSYVVVGDPSRQYLWILARQNKIEKSLYDAIVQRTKEKGFDVSKLKLANQSCH
jgi:apolipoprotein D and lipocalin family protein